MRLKQIIIWVNSLERKYAWGVIGTTVSITFGIIGIISLINPPTREIKFQTVDELQVFNLNKEIKDLTISFRGQELLSKNQNLVITRIKLQNSGDEEILPVYFDQNDPWGLKLKNGKIIEARIFDASSEYINNKINPQIVGDNLYQFQKIIFEKNEYVIFEILTIIQNKENPDFTVIGKVAGIDNIVIVKKKENPGEIRDNLFEFWNKVYYGNIIVHLTRFLLYLLFCFIFFAFISNQFISTEATEKKDQKKED